MKLDNIKELVIARIEAQCPINLKMSINSKFLSKGEMINHVKAKDKIGKAIINSHLTFIKSVANGEFIKAINSI